MVGGDAELSGAGVLSAIWAEEELMAKAIGSLPPWYPIRLLSRAPVVLGDPFLVHLVTCGPDVVLLWGWKLD